MFVDVHTHLTHEQFSEDLEVVIANAERSGLTAMVVNGLEPKSNRRILELAKKFPVIKPALGIYPVNAVWEELPPQYPYPVEAFSISEEIAFIREKALAKEIIAIGECGLDAHWLEPSTFPGQEKVFEQLIAIAIESNLPIIIHSRKREDRVFEILEHYAPKKVDLHCFGGKPNKAVTFAEKHNWFFSIPANAPRSSSFQKMLKFLPENNILTETDAPYLSPIQHQRNEPANVVMTVQLLATLRGWTFEEAKEKVYKNYCSLFLS